MLKFNKNFFRAIATITLFLLLSTGFAWATHPPSAQKETVRAAIFKGFPPHYDESYSGKYTGFARDSFDQIAKLADLQVKYIEVDGWKGAFAALDSGKVDVIPNLGITEARKKLYNYSTPYETFPVSIIIRSSGTKIEGPDDLTGKLVGVVKLNVGIKLMEPRDDLRIEVFENPQTALFELLAGHVDAIVFPSSVMLRLARHAKVGDLIKVVGAPLLEIKRAVAVRKDKPELLVKLNSTIEHFVSSKEYSSIYKKWFGTPIPYWTTKRVAAISALTFVIMAILMLLWRHKSLQRLNSRLVESMEDLKRTQESLLKSERRLSITLDSIGDAVIATDSRGHVTRMNSVSETLTGWKQSDAFGRPLNEVFYIISAITRKPAESPVEKVLSEGKIVGLANHTALISKDGTEYQIADSAAPIRESEGDEIHGVVLVFRDVTAEYAMQKAIVENEKKYRSLFAKMLNGFAYHEIITDESGKPVDYRYIEVNDAFTKLTGLKRKDIVGKTVLEVIPGLKDDEFDWIAFFGSVALEGKDARTEQYSKPLGKWYSVNTYSPKKGFFGALFEDITDRKNSEEHMRKSLLEKEVMLKEIHHRVKNNMAIISSLNRLQSNFVKSEAAREILKEGRTRIQSMALIHEMLYQSDSLSSINVEDYINKLARTLSHTFTFDDKTIPITVSAANIELDIDTLIPCGMIINELVTNSLKYAFDGHDNPEINITLSREGENKFLLTISDNGIGMPDDMDITDTGTLGLMIVNALVNQLEGTLELVRDAGIKIIIIFQE